MFNICTNKYAFQYWVGCVPPAYWLYSLRGCLGRGVCLGSGGVPWQGVCLGRGALPWQGGSTLEGGICLGKGGLDLAGGSALAGGGSEIGGDGGLPWQGDRPPPPPPPSWTEWVTHAWENITFARFAMRAVNIWMPLFHDLSFEFSYLALSHTFCRHAHCFLPVDTSSWEYVPL